MVTAPISRFSEASKADEIQAWFEAHPVPQASMGISQALEGIRARATTAALCAGGVAEFLAEWKVASA